MPPTFLAQLRRAIAQGVALASAGLAAGCDSSSPPMAAGLDAAADGGEERVLEPYELDALTCSGTRTRDQGPCCIKARCYTPEKGSECVPGETAALRDAGVPLPPGSGTCQCGLQGPFAANPDDEPENPGSCCYLVGSRGCTGRPLRQGVVWVVADVIARADWAAFT